MFAGVDPEFSVADERESWRMQQESMAAAIEEVFQEHPAGDAGAHPRAVVVRIRGGGALGLRRHARRGRAGGRAGRLPRSARRHAWRRWPRRCGRCAGNLTPVGVTHRRSNGAAALEGAGRIVTAAGPLEALRAIEEFSCNLQKCKKGNQAYDLLKRHAKTRSRTPRTRLITEYYAPQRQLLLEILRRFDLGYRERKRQAGALDFADLEEFAVRLLDEHAETRARVAGAVRPYPDGRISGHQRAAGQAAGAGARAGPVLRGGRHQPIDLRLPPRRAAGLPRVSRRGIGRRRPRWWS